MTRLLFGLIGVPAPRVHRWSHRAAFAVGVAAGLAVRRRGGTPSQAPGSPSR